MIGSAVSETPSADEVLAVFQEIVLSGQAIATAFSHPVRLTESAAAIPFALRAISAAGRRGLSQADLARCLIRSAPWTTRLIDHLELDGLVHRAPHPSDRRVNMLTLTNAGEQALNEFISRGRAAVIQLFPVHTLSSMNSLKTQLHKISELIG
jgi:DNA-binding MarR family transcriptional regulator